MVIDNFALCLVTTGKFKGIEIYFLLFKNMGKGLKCEFLTNFSFLKKTFVFYFCKTKEDETGQINGNVF